MTQFRTRRSSKFTPRIEDLEGRDVPAVVIQVTTAPANGGDIMKITGDSARDTVTITNLDGNGKIQVQATGLAARTFSNIRTINVFTNGGGDTVTYNQSVNLSRSLTLRTSLGAGDDRFTATVNGQVPLNRSLSLEADGGDGSDTIAATVNGTVAGKLTFDFHGGQSIIPLADGSDKIDAHYRGLLTGDIALKASGGMGADMIKVTLGLNAGSTGRVGSTTVGTADGTARVEGNGGGDFLTFVIDLFNDADPVRVRAEIDGGWDWYLPTDHGVRSTNVLAIGLETDTIQNAL